MVAAVGPGVTTAAVGDAVVVGSATPCRACRACAAGRYTQCPSAFGRGETPFTWNGGPVRSYANVSSFAERITVRADQLVGASGLAPTSAALIGCAVSTGYGVARNVARIRAGDAVVVLGVGGIGVNVIQTARLQGATSVVAVDVNPTKEDVARRFGASGFVLVPAGIDAAGLIELDPIRAGCPHRRRHRMQRRAGGHRSRRRAARSRVALLPWSGIPAPGARVAVDVNALLRQGRRIVGSLNGEIDPVP